jgi:chromosome segregation ATPase
LTKVAEKIIAEENSYSLWKRMAEPEEENSRLKATATGLQKSIDSSAEDVTLMRWSLEAGIEDYDLLLEGNNSLLTECTTLRDHAADLESELAEARANATKDIATLETRVQSAKAHVVDIAAAGEKRLVDFEAELINDLADLRVAYECNIQSIEGLCSPMPEGEPSIADYRCCLTAEVTYLSEANENFVSSTVKGVLVMARGSIDLAALQASTGDSRADDLPGE